MTPQSATRWWHRALGAAASLTAGILWLALALWIVGRVCTDRGAWTQWLWWMPSWSAMLIAASGLVLATRPARRHHDRRRRLLAWSMVMLIAAVHFGMIEHRLFRAAPDAPRGLKLVHWNIAAYSPPEEAVCAELIAATDADITVLTNAGRTPWDQVVLDWIAPARPQARGSFAILTRLPIEEVRWIIAEEGRSVVLLRVAGYVIYLVDLPSDPRLPRMPLARQLREQLDAIGAPAPDIVLGDLNVTRGSASLHAMFPQMHEAYDEGGHGYGATFPRSSAVYHLDHTLLAPNMRCIRYDILDAPFGRHLPQMAWVVKHSNKRP